MLKLFLICVILFYKYNFGNSNEIDTIKNWANVFGSNIWNFAKDSTNLNEIRKQYKNLNVQIDEKNPNELLKKIVQNIEKQIDGKLNAIENLKNTFSDYTFDCTKSRTHIENFSYVSMKYSNVLNENFDNLESNLKIFKKYQPIFLKKSSKFHNLSVDFQQSSVHVPTNIFDERKDIQCKINWTEKLDKVFYENYKKYNTMSWQHFCSSIGISRIYPGVTLNLDDLNEIDLFDCRKEPWFVESVTGRKNVIILFDNSGSMTGIHNHIAQLAINLMLDTFSNHDYINVYNFSENVYPIVECFRDNLIRATPNNIKIFKDHIRNVQLEGHENFTRAFIKVSDVFKEETNGNLNKNVLIIFTDNLPENLTRELSDRDNIEIFFYLIGRDIIRVDFKHLNNIIPKENFFHLQSLEEVIEQVIKYIPIIGKRSYQSLNMSYTWSHLFKSNTHDNNKFLSIALSTPIYQEEIDELIGAVAIDILINDEFYLYSYPYLTGVNGHSFIVNENGFIIMHNKLQHDSLLKSFNSIDIMDIELDEENSQLIKELRSNMINRRKGMIDSVKIVLNFEEMTKSFIQDFDYHFAPLARTPYSIAIRLPKLHGYYSIKVSNEVKRASLLKINLIEAYFKDDNWNIHPNWMYCKHKNQEMEHEDQKTQVLNYLKTIVLKKPFKSIKYSCDDDLIKKLIFDARLTNNILINNSSNISDVVYLKFLATMSGLVRWKSIISTDYNLINLTQSIDEDWYKIAVFYHSIDSESFVFSLLNNKQSIDETKILATHAVFPRDAGREAPGLVVGLVFTYEYILNEFLDIVDDSEQHLSCNSGEYDCFVIDHFGYVIISKDFEHVGRFFGEIDGAVTEKLILDGVFVKTVINDSQKMCNVQELISNNAFSLTKISYWIEKVFQSFIMQFFMFLYKLSMNYLNVYGLAFESKVRKNMNSQKKEEDEYFNRKIEPVYRNIEEPCFETMDRYYLSNKSVKYQSSSQFIQSNCSRPFFYMKIPHTNLLMVIIKALFPTCYKQVSISRKSHFKKDLLQCFY